MKLSTLLYAAIFASTLRTMAFAQLFASKEIHGNARAGEPLLIVPGLDAMDASLIATDFLGHSYFRESWPLLSDIHSLLFNDELASQRFGLTTIDTKDGEYCKALILMVSAAGLEPATHALKGHCSTN